MPTKDHPGADNAFTMPLRVLQFAIQAVPAVKYALGVAGMGAAGAILYLFFQSPRVAFLTLLGMLVFMGLLYLFAGLGKTIPKGGAAHLRLVPAAVHGHLYPALHLGLLPMAARPR